MTFSREAKDIMLKAVQANQTSVCTEAQKALAHAVTHGENNAEVLTRLIDDVRG